MADAAEDMEWRDYSAAMFRGHSKIMIREQYTLLSPTGSLAAAEEAAPAGKIHLYVILATSPWYVGRAQRDATVQDRSIEPATFKT